MRALNARRKPEPEAVPSVSLRWRLTSSSRRSRTAPGSRNEAARMGGLESTVPFRVAAHPRRLWASGDPRHEAAGRQISPRKGTPQANTGLCKTPNPLNRTATAIRRSGGYRSTQRWQDNDDMAKMLYRQEGSTCTTRTCSLALELHGQSEITRRQVGRPLQLQILG